MQKAYHNNCELLLFVSKKRLNTVKELSCQHELRQRWILNIFQSRFHNQSSLIGPMGIFGVKFFKLNRTSAYFLKHEPITSACNHNEK